MNDYTCEWPLWSGRHEAYMKYISSDLKDRVKAWANHFNKNYHWEHGWKMADQENSHFKEGETLMNLLNQELDADPSTDWFVYLDFWERMFSKGW